MSKDQDTEKQEYEKRLRERLALLRNLFKEGKVHMVDDPVLKESLLAVRNGPDGEIDLDTVNGAVRSMALGLGYMHEREEIKNEMPLKEIQEAYFKCIEINFGEIFKTMVERGATPNQMGNAMSRSPESVDSLIGQIPKFIEFIEQFWENASDAVYAHVEDMSDSHKGVFGGDLFPSHNENIASKCGIYADTIILPDPFLRSKLLFPRWPKKEQTYYFIKHAMNILQY